MTGKADSRKRAGGRLWAFLLENRWPVLFTAFFTIINIRLAVQYEPWRDVAQAWLIGRDLSYPEMLRTIHYDGHPILWYFILSLFGKAGLPFSSIFVISIGLSMTGIWLFARYSPFSAAEKFVLLFGTGFILNLPVVARNYALFPILIFSLAALYPRRHEKPLLYCILIALLLQTHVFLAGFAGALTILFLGEWIAGLLRRRRRGKKASGAPAGRPGNGRRTVPPETKEFLGMVLIAVSLVMMYLELRSEGNGSTAMIVQGSEAAKLLPMAGGDGASSLTPGALKPLVKAILQAPLIFINRLSNLEIWNDTNTWFGVLLLALIVLACAVTDWKMAFVLLLSYGWLAAVDVLIMPIYTDQKQAAILLLFLFCVWQCGKQRTAACRILLFAALFLSVLTWSTTAVDLREQGYISTSAGKAAAAYIRTELPEDAVIVIDNEVYVSSVAAYLPEEQIYNPNRDNHHGFGTWDSQVYHLYSEDGTLHRLTELVDRSYGRRADGSDGAEYYYLASLMDENSVRQMAERSRAEGDPEKISEMTRWVNARNDENYILYRVSCMSE